VYDLYHFRPRVFCSTISIQESKCFVLEKYLTIIRSNLSNISKESSKMWFCNHHILRGLRWAM